MIQTVAPASEPVDVPMVKRQARIDADLADEDELLSLYIQAARAEIENETGRQLLRATWVYRASGFPRGGVLTLPKPPLISVTSVVYIDTAGVAQTWASSNYLVSTYGNTDHLSLASGISWPSVRDQANAVTITYLAGYGGAPAQVPAPLRTAILLWAAHMYKNREPVSDKPHYEMPLSIERLVFPYRIASVLVG